MRLVLDTNVLLAAFIARGTCHDLLEHCEQAHDLVHSEFILNEFEAKLVAKFRVPAAGARAVTALLRTHAEIVDPGALKRPACRDPDDDWVLAAAVAGRCSCLVTGDKELLVLAEYERIPILTPGAFWTFERENPPSA